MKPTYILERYPHGWMFCSVPGATGIPVDALTECSRIMPRDSFMCMDINTHYKNSGKYDAVCCVATKSEGNKWRAEITQFISFLEPELRWWRGLDVGTSSAAIFSVLCRNIYLTGEAERMANVSTPMDAEDFGRCQRLISLFPEWKSKLSEIADKYPSTKWPAIIARWDELCFSSNENKTKILSGL